MNALLIVLALTHIAALVAGAVIAAAVIARIMPGLMVQTFNSRLGFEETFQTVQDSMKKEGWNIPSTMDMNATLTKHGIEFGPKVRTVEMCKPDYAHTILGSDRHMSCLMPCSISVWEDDNGDVFVSKLNQGLLGKLFGGNIKHIMSDKISSDQAGMIEAIQT